MVGASSGDGYCWVLLLLLNGASCFVAEGEFWFLRGGSGVVHSGCLVRSSIPAGGWLGETLSASWNKVLQITLFFTGAFSGAGVESVSLGASQSWVPLEMSGWDSLCTGVCLFFLGDAAAVVFPGLVVATWCSGREDDGGRGLKSGEPTTAGLLPSTSCSLPKLGVCSLISQGEDGRWRIRGVAQAWVKH